MNNKKLILGSILISIFFLFFIVVNHPQVFAETPIDPISPMQKILEIVRSWMGKNMTLGIDLSHLNKAKLKTIKLMLDISMFEDWNTAEELWEIYLKKVNNK